jgi:VWFA-related protein
VTGLQRGDFTLLEDGKPMEVVNFDALVHQAVASPGPPPPGTPASLSEASEIPASTAPAVAPDAASWIVYIDDFYIGPAHRARVLRQLRDFLTQGLAPGDPVMVVTYDRGLHIRLPFSTDRDSLVRALAGVESLPASGGDLVRARREALARILDELGETEAESGGSSTAKEKKRIELPELPSTSTGPKAPQCPFSASDPAKSYASAVRHEVLSSLSALTVLVNSLSGIPGRKVLLHVSDGIPLTPGEDLFQVLYEICGGGSATGLQSASVPVFDGGGSSLTGYRASQAALDAQSFSTAKEWTTFASHANAQRVTLYTIQASGAEASGAGADDSVRERVLSLSSVVAVESQNRQQTLSVMASETGGRAVFWANDIRPELAHIQEDLASYYSLGFNPPHVGDGREHRIEVRLRGKGSGLSLRYRRSYRDKPALERAVDHTLAGLLYGYQDNPLDVRMEIGESTPDGDAWSVPVRLHIPLFKLGLQTRSDGYEGRLRLLVAARDAQGETSPVRHVEVPIHIPHPKAMIALGQSYLYEIKMTLKSGEQRLAIAVSDEATTTTSFLARTLQVGPTEKATEPVH